MQVSYLLIAGWFGAGFLASFHCVAMCGTLVVAYVCKGLPSDKKKGISFSSHLVYNGCKLVSYTLAGTLLGLIGKALNLGGIRGWVSIAAGLFMILLGISMLGIFPSLRRLSLPLPKGLKNFLYGSPKDKKAKKASLSLSSRRKYFAPATFGLISALLPCGPLQAMELFAAGTGSPSKGALAMFVFGVGTLPLMLGFQAATSTLAVTFRKQLVKVAAVIVCLLGIFMLNRGLVLKGVPYNLGYLYSKLGSAVRVTSDKEQATKDKVQKLTLYIRDVQYQPSTLVVKKDIPVELTVIRQEDVGCSRGIVFASFDIEEELPDFGKKTISFTPTETGTFPFTCSMGMMQGQIQVNP